MVDEAWPLAPQEVAGDREGALAWIEYALYRGAVGLGSRLPDGARAALAGGLARACKALDRRRSDAARAFLRQAFGPQLDPRRREQLVLASWRHLIGLVLEDARFNERVLGP